MLLRVQLRRDTAANWAANNPILSVGECGLELDDDGFVLALKFGDGVAQWNDLDYFSQGETAFPIGPAGGVLSGLYPDPGFAEPMATSSDLDDEATDRAAGDALALQKSANLSDVASTAAARTSLGLGTAATHLAGDFDPAGTATATVAGHVSTGDPHPGYLTPEEGNSAYDVLGAAGSVFGALSTHATSGVHTSPQPPIIGSTGSTAVAGNDGRLTDVRTPTDASVTPAKFNASAVDPAAGVAGARTLGIGAQQAAAGSALAAKQDNILPGTYAETETSGVRMQAANAATTARVIAIRSKAVDYSGNRVVINDGATHLLSAHYPSLASAQATFPHAVALSDELAWAAIQAAINEAGSTAAGGEAAGDVGNYWINRALSAAASAVTVSGPGRGKMTVTQRSTSAHGVSLGRDTSNGNTFTKNLRFRGFSLVGPGQGVSTGTGFYGHNDASTYQGQVGFDDVDVNNFDTCYDLCKWDNSWGRAIGVSYCRLGWWSSGNANTIQLDISASNCTEAVSRFGDGAGVVVQCRDLISSGMMVDALDQSQVTIVGGNWESCTGSTAFCHVNNGARVVSTVGRILKNIGNDVPGFLVENGGVLTVLSPPAFAGFSTSKTIRKASTSATVYALAPSRSLSSAAELLVDEGGVDSYPALPWPTRQDNSVGTASANIRGLPLAKMYRTGSNGEDQLLLSVRDRSSGSDVYNFHALTGRIRGSGTPLGNVSASPGVLYSRDDAPDIANAFYFKLTGTGTSGWVAIGAAGTTGPAGGLQAGDAIRQMWRTGTWVIPKAGTSTSGSLGLGNLRLFPVEVPYNGGTPWTISAFQADVTNASDSGLAGGVFRFAVYGDNSFYPGSLLLDTGTLGGSGTGSVATNAIAVPTITLATPLSIPDNLGIIWIGGAVQGWAVTAPTLRILSNVPIAVPSSTTPTAGEARWGYVSSATYAGALPGTFPASQAPTGSVPRISVKL